MEISQRHTQKLSSLRGTHVEYRINSASFRAYTPYGHVQYRFSHQELLGFNGELLERHSETYLLGNGYRPYNPATMRFSAPDNLSPFGKGGLNAYGYCTGDPVNQRDPSGHAGMQQKVRPDLWRSRGPIVEPEQMFQQQGRRLIPRQQHAARQPGRHPFAPEGGRGLYSRRDVANARAGQAHNAPARSGDRIAVPSAAQPSTPPTRSMEDASRIYDDLVVAHGHIQRFERDVALLTPGTELYIDHQNTIDRIRRHAASLRSQLGVDNLRWLHL
ncbi:MAG: RHS repeat-associated core domain-containing protein [Pseudomonas sp.]|nr:RHS repeat-associated core domain-containing protein [Pseudomonas sp.]